MKGCADIGTELGLEVKPGFLPRECCISCHDDLSEHGEPLVEAIESAEVCCAIWRLYDDRKGGARADQETQA